MSYPRISRTPVTPQTAHATMPIQTLLPPMQTPSPRPRQHTPPHASLASEPKYPLQIAPEKFPKALKLYNKFYLEKGLAQRTQSSVPASESMGRLHVLGGAQGTRHSSPGSSRAYTASVSNSQYDGVTGTESVVSFTGEDSPGSMTPNGSELISFTGQRVRQRTRRPLSPVSKAKAALIRHLESCSVCRARRVPCPLEHHDIASLERARVARAHARQRAHSIRQLQSSGGSNSGPAAVRASARPSMDLGSQSQTASLLWVGGGVDQGHTHAPPHAGARLSGNTPMFANPLEVDVLTGIPIHPGITRATNLAMPVPEPTPVTHNHPEPASTYQDEQMFPLGLLNRPYYFCSHFDGCNRPFPDAESLQTHFESHFAYQRLTPAHRHVCTLCGAMNEYASSPCCQCGASETIQTWIYGRAVSDALSAAAAAATATATASATSPAVSGADSLWAATSPSSFTSLSPASDYAYENASFGLL